MSVTIDHVSTDGRFVLNNSSVGRVLAIGNNWSRLRIGIRMTCDDTGSALGSTPRFYLGAMSNPASDMSNGPLSSSCSHFVGMVTNGPTWTRYTSPTRYNPGGVYSAAKKIGSTLTTAGSSNDSNIVTGVMLGCMVELVKGSPNFTIWRCPSYKFSANTNSELITAMQTNNFTTAASNLTTVVATSTAIAVDEATNGNLNAIVVAWDKTNPLRFSECYWSIF